MNAKILLGFALLSSMPHLADEPKPALMFVNLNYSSAELKAMQDLARERGQDLYVVPPVELVKYGEDAATLEEKSIEAIKKAHPELDEASRYYKLFHIMAIFMKLEELSLLSPSEIPLAWVEPNAV